MDKQIMRLAIIGAGRIAHVHAAAAAGDPGVRLVCVADIRAVAAKNLAVAHGIVVTDTDHIFDNADVDAVLIASPTPTHAEFLKRAARAGKAVLCEKPIAFDLDETRAAVNVVKQSGITCALGFNRRHDAQFRRLRESLLSGAIGKLETLTIISRDPEPPGMDYIRHSGGLFRDMMIHDLDMARWLLNEPVTEVTAHGSVLIDPAIGEAGDVDTAMVTLITASGRLCHIENSRRAAYGYDQRIEAFGSEGMLQTVNETQTRLRRTTAVGELYEPPKHFFLERYADAYAREVSDLRDAWANGRRPVATEDDGYEALRLADAAMQSLELNRTVRVDAEG